MKTIPTFMDWDFSRMKWIIFATIVFFIAGAAFFLVPYIENRYLFLPNFPKLPQNPLEAVHSQTLKAKIHEVYFPSLDGTRLNGWYIPAEENHPTIVFAHGNGGNLAFYQPVIQAFVSHGYGVFTFDYRGYGKSEGTPSEEGVYEDFEAASQYVTSHYKIPIQQQIAVGDSLGGAVVIQAATHHPYRAVVTISTFTDIPEVAHHLRQMKHLGLLNHLPVEDFIHQKFDSINKIQKVKSPLLVIHGSADHFIPKTMSTRLFMKAKSNDKKLLIIPGSRHNDIFPRGSQEIFSALQTLLNTQQSSIPPASTKNGMAHAH